MKALVVAVALVAAMSTTVPSAGAAATRSQVVVRWHPQMAALGPSGTVEGAWADLLRNANGISYSLHASQLTPGNAYTLWQVVANNPAACASSPCTAGDFFTRPAVDAQVSYATGHVVGGSGKATFAGSQREGAIPEGWIEFEQATGDRIQPGLSDAMAAEVHLVVNDHGPALSEFMPGMIRTYRGGCSDSSPFPALFPQKALDDGEAGPNTCRLTQMAVFQ